MQYIDLTLTIGHQMPVFPGETKPSILRDALPEDAGYVTHRLESNMHTGTHIDAPFHAKSGSVTIDRYPVDFFTGPALVIDVRGEYKVSMQAKWEALFPNYKIVLFCTGFSKMWGNEKYYFEYPEFDSSVADALVRSGVRIAGFDSPSPDKAPFQFHSIFLNEERFLVENLTNLEMLIDKNNTVFTAFPLKIEAEASLIRAVASFEEKG